MMFILIDAASALPDGLRTDLFNLVGVVLLIALLRALDRFLGKRLPRDGD